MAMAIEVKVAKQHSAVAVLVFVLIKVDLFLVISNKISFQDHVKFKK